MIFALTSRSFVPQRIIHIHSLLTSGAVWCFLLLVGGGVVGSFCLILLCGFWGFLWFFFPQHSIWADSVWSPSPNLFKNYLELFHNPYCCLGLGLFFLNSNINCWQIRFCIALFFQSFLSQKSHYPWATSLPVLLDKQLCSANNSWYLSDFGRTQTWNKNESCSIPAILTLFSFSNSFKNILPPLSISCFFWVTWVDTSYEPPLEAAMLQTFSVNAKLFILTGKCFYPSMVNITTNITFCLSFFSVLHISFSSSKDVVLYLTYSVEQKCVHLCSSLSLTAQYFKFTSSPIYFVFFEFFKFSLCFWKGAVKFLYFSTLTMPHLCFWGFFCFCF